MSDGDAGNDERADVDDSGSPGSRGIDATLSEPTVRAMVAERRPEWTVASIDRSPLGTDFVAVLGIEGPDAPDRAVLKATTADLVPPPVARAEPRLLEFVGRETGIPVPEVYGTCGSHEAFPAPFSLLEFVEGETYEGPPPDLDPDVRERIVRDAGRYLGELHALGPLETHGRLGVPGDEPDVADGGDLRVLDTAEHPSRDDPREAMRAAFEPALSALESGTWFPERADDPDRFADLVPDVRAWVDETIPGLPAPEPPTYCHGDYRYGNFVVDPETGAIEAVLDWANASAADPAYGLATAESHLLTPEGDGEERTAELRAAFRSAYATERDGWRFDDATTELMRVYRLAKRLDAMACLPLWYEDATPTERDERAAEHRAFVRESLDGERL